MGEWSKAETHCAWCGEAVAKHGVCHNEACHMVDAIVLPPDEGDLVLCALRARVEELEAEHEDQIIRICDALIEVGPWDDIDGDGDEAEVIVRHIHQLAAAESSAPDNEGGA